MEITSTNEQEIKSGVRDMSDAVYSADGKRLLIVWDEYDCDEYFDYDVKDGTEVICDEAFAYCDHLVEVKLPSTVKYIGYYAFGACENLAEINLPASVIYIDEYAFESSNQLCKIYIPKDTRPKFEQLLDEKYHHMLEETES